MGQVTATLLAQVQAQAQPQPASPLSVDLLASAQWVNDQRAAYPTRPYNPPDTFRYTEGLADLQEEIDREGYLYLGQSQHLGLLLTPARREVEPHHVFVARMGVGLARFIYIPIRLWANGQQILTIPNWTFDGATCDFPEMGVRVALFPSVIGDWPRIHQIYTADYYHPLVFGLGFTGYAVEAIGGAPLWQYVDRLGWWGPRGTTYLDSNAPLGMPYPLGIPTEGQLQIDPYYTGGQALPSSGTFDQVGYYLGYYTTPLYSATTFYLYDMDGVPFLSPAPPLELYVEDMWQRAIPHYQQTRWGWGLSYDPLNDIQTQLGGTLASRMSRQQLLKAMPEAR